MKKNVELHNLDTITITVHSKDGIVISETIDVNTIHERINNVLYQTFNNAIGRTARDLLNQINYKNLPDTDFFKDLQAGMFTVNDILDIRYYEYSKRMNVANIYYAIDESDFEYTKKLALLYLKNTK